MASSEILFIGSQLLTAELWSGQIAALAPGTHGSVADHTRGDTVQTLARSILAAAPESFGLVALGMGGFIAFEMLRQSPARVRRLMLVSTLASSDTPAQTARRQNYLRLVEAGQYAAVIDERLPILLSTARRHDAALVALARRMATATGAECFLRQQRAIMSRPDSRPLLPQIACPTTIVYGREDGITTLAHQQEMLSVIPDARLEIVESCGHLVPLEQPVLFQRLLASWKHQATARRAASIGQPGNG